MRPENYNPLTLIEPNIDTLSLSLIPENSRVLDLGCNSGYLGNVMRRELGCTVIGVERNKKLATSAKKLLKNVIIGDIENSSTLRKIAQNGPYDLIFASAVLEHLVHPEANVRTLSKQLKRGGSFIITLPNIVHWTARLAILRGNFAYQDAGLFDRTHLHFYTLESARAFLRNCQLNSVHEDFEFFGPKLLSSLFRSFPALFAYQFVFKAKPNAHAHRK